MRSIRISLLRSQSGFTLPELCVVIIILGILANIAIPVYSRTEKHANAAHIVADVHAIRNAALGYYADNGDFPPNGPWGQVPPQLASYLPGNFSFVYLTARYRWRSWPQRRWTRRKDRGQPIIAVVVRSNDKDLMNSLKGVWQGRLTAAGNRLTLVLD